MWIEKEELRRTKKIGAKNTRMYGFLCELWMVTEIRTKAERWKKPAENNIATFLVFVAAAFSPTVKQQNGLEIRFFFLFFWQEIPLTKVYFAQCQRGLLLYACSTSNFPSFFFLAFVSFISHFTRDGHQCWVVKSMPKHDRFSK